MVVSSLHLIGYLSSKALSMKSTFNWVVLKLQLKLLPLSFKNSLVCILRF
jgi:hypothetical protein